jgi:hypothetical protein
MEYVLNGGGIFGDLSQPGILAQLLSRHLQTQQDREAVQLRWDSVRTRFGWQTLASQYDRLFRDVLER